VAALRRLQKASGVLKRARVRLLPGSLTLLDAMSSDVRLVEMRPGDAYRLARDLLKRARKAGA
jgi:hypothetical protein